MRDSINEEDRAGKDFVKYMVFVSLIGALNGILIFLTEQLYIVVAAWALYQENSEYEDQKSDSWIVKNTVFQ